MLEKEEDKSPEDFDLLAEFNSGSEEAFTRIVQKHSGALINFLYRYTQDQGASEDIAQEAFLRLYTAAPGLKPGAKLSTILYKIAYNLAVDQARKDISRAARAPTQSLDCAGAEGPLEPHAAPGTGPEAIYEKAGRDAEIADSLAELPANQQLVLILKAYEGRSYAEIAEITGLSLPAVDSLIFRARQSLSKKLK